MGSALSWAIGAAACLGWAFEARAAAVSAEAPFPVVSGMDRVRASGPSVDYELQVRLDDERHQVTGSGVITLHNRTTSALTKLYVHLYLNAFESARSVFYRSSARGRGGQMPRQWGHIDVLHFAREGTGGELWPASAHSPDDPEDRTDIELELQEPVLAGDSARFEVAWTSQLPSLVERTGFVEDFHFMGQWFPKLAKLESDGAWVHFTFHPHSEFYANFGEYSVTMDVADEMVVGATGTLLTQSADDGRKRLTYRASAVHDFAWTAWRGFETRTDVVGATRIHTLFPPGHGKNRERSLLAAAQGLAFLGKRFGAYPYADFTVVHPPDWARAAGGMEYPTLITAGGPWYVGYLSRAMEEVTLHELAHQWFHGLLASNESAWPFLDEGFTSYAEARAMADLYGSQSAVDLPGLGIGATAYFRWWGNDASAPIAQPAAGFSSFEDLGKLAYSRAATLLETLSRVYPEFDQVLGAYVRRSHFTHPTPAQFLDAVEQGLGSHVRLQCERTLFEKATVDFKVSFARSEATAAGHAVEVEVVRSGELEFEVELELLHTDGSVVRRRWDGRGSGSRFEYVASAALRGVVVDPGLRVLLDSDLSNNAWVHTPSPRPTFYRRALHWLSLLLRSFAP